MLQIESECVLQAEPSVKNAHSASHLRVHGNLVLVCMEEAVYVYSLARAARGAAPLVSIIRLAPLFAGFPKEHYQDFVSSIFRNAEKQDFSSQIFSRAGDTRSNALLRTDSIRDRIAFFNNTAIRVARFELNPAGEILILLADGRAAVIQDCHSHAHTLNLNELTKERIRQACFISRGVCLATAGKLFWVPDLRERGKVASFKVAVEGVCAMHGRVSVRDRVEVCLVTARQLHVLELKKKVLSTAVLPFDHFVSQTFHYGRLLYAASLHALERIDLDTMTRQVLTTFSVPTELLYVDRFGSAVARSNSTGKEALWLLDSTANGVFVGQTIRRNGNYKEGRLLIFEPQLPYFLTRLLHTLKDDASVDISDALFVRMTPENKALLQEVINLSKTGSLVFQGTELTAEEYNALCINITHAFEGKELVKQKIIERALRLRFEGNPSTSRKCDLRCCFTGRELNDEVLSHCEACNLYGVEAEGSRCVVCRRDMVRYE